MYKKIILVLLFIFSFTSIATVYSKEVPFTQDDRDRIIRLEVKVEELEKRIDSLERNLTKSIDELRTYMLSGFAILFMGIFALIGFVIWDRRTALAPVAKKNKEIEEKTELIEKTLKEYAKVEPKLAEIMKSFRLM